MGYLTDIVRDSRRRTCVARAPGESSSVDHVEIPAAATVAPATVVAGPPAAMSATASVERIREEGSGRPDEAGQHAAESGFATRQVAGPSPSEHVPAAGLPEATSEGLHLSDPVPRTQAGCESARTVTDGFRAEKAERFRGGDSNDAPAVPGVEDGSSILESSPGYAATSRAGKESVETQERRQAGIEPRAGSVTPPEQFDLDAAPEASGRNDGGPAAVKPGASPVEDDRSAVQLEKISFTEENCRVRLEGAATNCMVTLPAGIPAQQPRSGRAPETCQPVRQRTAEGENKAGKAPWPQEPRVSIGAIEVVVVSPAPAQPEPSRGERFRPDPTSRNYLRNF